MVLHALNIIALYGVNAVLGIVAIWLLLMPRPLPFLALSVGVMPFISLACASPVSMNVWNITGYLIMVALIAACFAVDAIALTSWKRFAAAERARTHAAHLERQLDTHLAAVDAMREEAGRAARFRHDERNHLQALMALIESGQTTRAASYAAELRQALSTEGERA